MPPVIIMRGVAGSGKSTFLQKHFPGFLVCSADKHRMVEGKYVYSTDDNGRVHDSCLRDFIKAIRNNTVGIAVDNTNSRLWELAPYYRVAQVYGYTPTIFWLVCDPACAHIRNIHGVPHHTIVSMANKFEPIPEGWIQKIITPELVAAHGFDPRSYIFPQEDL